MSSRWRWILVLVAATGLDLLARFGMLFDFNRVMHVEAVLFPTTAAGLATLLRYDAGLEGWPRTLRVGLVWLFGLGGIRPVLRTLGLPLTVANLATLTAALVGVPIWVVWHRRRVVNIRGSSANTITKDSIA